MVIKEILKKETKNTNFLKINKHFESILFNIILNIEEREIRIPLIHSDISLYIIIQEREESIIGFKVKIKYNYEIRSDIDDKIISKNKLDDYFIFYEGNFFKFFKDLKISILSYIDSVKGLVLDFEELISQIIYYFQIIEDLFGKINESIKEEYLQKKEIVAKKKIKKFPFNINPFELQHFPISYEGKSIIQFRRKDNAFFTKNNRYIINRFLYEAIPIHKILNYTNNYLRKENNKLLNKLFDHSKGMKEFGLYYNTLISDEHFLEYKELFNGMFNEYSEVEDISEAIANKFLLKLTNSLFADKTNKFKKTKASIEKKEIKQIIKYRIIINYNFYDYDTERLEIIYYQGHKYFWVFLRTKYTHNANKFKIFIDNKAHYIIKENIEEFFDLLISKIYPYEKDVDEKTIFYEIDAIKIEKLNQNTNDHSFQIIRVGDKVDYNLTPVPMELGKAIIEKIEVGEKYERKEYESFHLHIDYPEAEMVAIKPELKEFGFSKGQEYKAEVKYTIIDFKPFEETEDIELSEFYKQIDQVKIKLENDEFKIMMENKKLDDATKKKYKEQYYNTLNFYVFEKDKDINQEVVIYDQKATIGKISINSDNSRLEINTNRADFVFELKRIISIQRKDGSTKKSPYRCVGIAENIDDLEEIDSILVVLLNPDGTFSEISLMFLMDNPTYTIIDHIGKVNKILISEDNSRVEITIDNDTYKFSIEQEKLEVFKKSNKKYILFKELELVTFFRNQPPTDLPQFEEQIAFELFKIPTKRHTFKKPRTAQELQKKIEIVRKKPDNIPYEKVIKEKKVEEKPEKVIKKKLSEEELKKLFKKETGATKTIYRGVETKRYKKWKEETLEKIGEVIEEVDIHEKRLRDLYKKDTGKSPLVRGESGNTTPTYKEWRDKKLKNPSEWILDNEDLIGDFWNDRSFTERKYLLEYLGLKDSSYDYSIKYSLSWDEVPFKDEIIKQLWDKRIGEVDDAIAELNKKEIEGEEFEELEEDFDLGEALLGMEEEELGKGYIEIGITEGRWIIKPKNRVFTPEEESFYEGLRDSIGVEFIEDVGTYVGYPNEDKIETLEEMINNFYEFFEIPKESN